MTPFPVIESSESMSWKSFLKFIVATVVALGLVVASGSRAVADDPAPNPPWPSYCGLKLGLVLDLSGSLSDADVQQSKDASVAAVQALAGTNSSVGLHTYSSDSPHDGAAGPIEYLPVSVASTAAAQPLKDYIANFDRGFGGSTNWAAAFSRVTSLSLDYDAVLMVTDGYPNSLAPAIDAANVLKNAGTRVVGVGVGAGANDAAIKQISSEDAYYPVASFDDLVDSLKEAALESCKGSVNITTLVDQDDGTAPAPAAGWTFTGPGSVEGSATTTVSGVATLTYTDDQTSVTITEQAQQNYAIKQQNGANAVCTINGSAVAVVNVANGFQVGPFTAADVVICTVVNVAVDSGNQITWTKTDPAGALLGGSEWVVSGPGGFTLAVLDNGTNDADDAVGALKVLGLPDGDYGLVETKAPAGYVAGTVTTTVTVNPNSPQGTFGGVVNTPVTTPPVTTPPVTSPPVTSPPVTSPPVTSPPPVRPRPLPDTGR